MQWNGIISFKYQSFIAVFIALCAPTHGQRYDLNFEKWKQTGKTREIAKTTPIEE